MCEEFDLNEFIAEVFGSHVYWDNGCTHFEYKNCKMVIKGEVPYEKSLPIAREFEKIVDELIKNEGFEIS